MALTDEGTNTTMLVQPSGFGNNDGFMGGNGWWILILFILLGGWGNGFGMGGGAWGMDGLYPWMNNSQNINNGFRDQMLNDNITSIRDGIYGINNQLCTGFAGVNASINGAQNAIAQQLYTNQISDLERSFAAQTASTQGMTAIQAQLAQCCCDNRLATNDLKYTIATENCADRAALSDGIRDILAAQNAGIQSIKDQLCQDKIDAKNDTIAQLRQELLFARGQASQDVQTAALQANNAVTANQLVQELRSCPIPSMPVYGMTPVFTCGSNNGCGCGCGTGAF
jgi:hypothetical protein